MRMFPQFWLLLFAFYGSCFQLDSYAAMGDSYATGAGAGDALVWPPADAKCGRFAEAYPRQIVTANKGTIFRNLACGGSSTGSVLLSQVPWIEDSQVITLTVGGNEVDFFKVVNDCVYEWVPLADCNATIAQSRSIIESDLFRKNLEKLIKSVVAKKVIGSRLLVTGYAKFFNDKTKQCNGVSFSRTNPESTLRTAKRAELNDLLRLLNNVINTTAVDNGAEYVDLDAVFEGHRFCEEGVIEPDVNRKATWFLTIQPPRTKDYAEQTVVTQDIPEFAVFHPTTMGQKAVAEAIMKQLDIK